MLNIFLSMSSCIILLKATDPFRYSDPLFVEIVTSNPEFYSISLITKARSSSKLPNASEYGIKIDLSFCGQLRIAPNIYGMHTFRSTGSSPPMQRKPIATKLSSPKHF